MIEQDKRDTDTDDDSIAENDMRGKMVDQNIPSRQYAPVQQIDIRKSDDN